MPLPDHAKHQPCLARRLGGSRSGQHGRTLTRRPGMQEFGLALDAPGQRVLDEGAAALDYAAFRRVLGDAV